MFPAGAQQKGPHAGRPVAETHPCTGGVGSVPVTLRFLHPGLGWGARTDHPSLIQLRDPGEAILLLLLKLDFIN